MVEVAVAAVAVEVDAASAMPRVGRVGQNKHSKTPQQL